MSSRQRAFFTIDARVPVIFTSSKEAGPTDTLLIEGEPHVAHGASATFQPDLASIHPAGCACCQPRNPAGRALAGLLQDRARGKVAFFTRVIAVTTTLAGRATVEAALLADPVAAACFRLA